MYVNLSLKILCLTTLLHVTCSEVGVSTVVPIILSGNHDYLPIYSK